METLGLLEALDFVGSQVSQEQPGMLVQLELLELLVALDWLVSLEQLDQLGSLGSLGSLVLQDWLGLQDSLA